jgi:hypothetical protein
MSERTKALLVLPVAGFFVVIAFGVGLIAEGAFGGTDLNATALSTESADSGDNAVTVELGDLFINPARSASSRATPRSRCATTGRPNTTSL